MPILRPQRLTLKTSPSLQVMKRYVGTHFFVFVDESFYRFLDFRDLQGNFCSGVLCISEREYLSFSRKYSYIRDKLASENILALTVGSPTTELKYSTLNKSDPSVLANAAASLDALFAMCGVTISAFFTSVAGYIAEEVRGQLEAEENLTLDSDGVISAALEAKRLATNGSKAAILSHLLALPLSGLCHFLSSFNCTFEVFLDPRERSEDAEVERSVTEFANVLKTVLTTVGGSFASVSTSITSDRSAGLQVADWIAGMARAWYRANDNHLNWKSSYTLITPESDEPIQEFMPIARTMAKIGHAFEIPPSVVGGLRSSAHPRSFALLLDHVIASVLLYRTNHGINRAWRIKHNEFFDALD